MQRKLRPRHYLCGLAVLALMVFVPKAPAATRPGTCVIGGCPPPGSCQPSVVPPRSLVPSSPFCKPNGV